MEPITRYIDLYLPTETCNLRCPYCYITQKRKFDNAVTPFNHSPEYIRQAFSKKRWGGLMLLSICAGGETLLCDDLIPVVEQLLLEGHYVMLVTNGVLSKQFVKLSKIEKNLLKRLVFKFSFHYLELKRTNNMHVFFDNIRMMKNAGCSFTVEITPYDELSPYIDDIKKACMENAGALCHVTIPRDVHKPKQVELLSEHSLEEFYQIWKSFDSELLDFKKSIFFVKRNEYCHAGAWTYFIDIVSGDVKQCYSAKSIMNIYDDINEPIKEVPVGHDCIQPHCYNGHAFLALGAIPELDTPAYAKLRDRITTDGSSWLNDEMRNFMSQKINRVGECYEKI